MKFYDSEGTEVKLGDWVIAINYWPSRLNRMKIVDIRGYNPIRHSTMYLSEDGSYDAHSSYTRPDERGYFKRIIKEKKNY